jgi:hypothetical protein
LPISINLRVIPIKFETLKPPSGYRDGDGGEVGGGDGDGSGGGDEDGVLLDPDFNAPERDADPRILYKLQSVHTAQTTQFKEFQYCIKNLQVPYIGQCQT